MVEHEPAADRQLYGNIWPFAVQPLWSGWIVYPNRSYQRSRAMAETTYYRNRDSHLQLLRHSRCLQFKNEREHMVDTNA